eukprot:11959896-Alexandrium_andersonii.AAC.1
MPTNWPGFVPRQSTRRLPGSDRDSATTGPPAEHALQQHALRGNWLPTRCCFATADRTPAQPACSRGGAD